MSTRTVRCAIDYTLSCILKLVKFVKVLFLHCLICIQLCIHVVCLAFVEINLYVVSCVLKLKVTRARL